MKKSLIVSSILLSLFLFASIVYAELADWEKQAYYDLLEAYAFSPRNYDNICAEVASRHGITVEELKSIKVKAYAQEPTDWEWKVYDELNKRVGNLSGGAEGSSNEARKRVYQEVAANYGIRLGELYSIENRCLDWDY